MKTSHADSGFLRLGSGGDGNAGFSQIAMMNVVARCGSAAALVGVSLFQPLPHGAKDSALLRMES